MGKEIVTYDIDFIILSNDFLRDSRLSWAAKGLMSYVSMLGNGKALNIGELLPFSADKERSLYNAIKELEKLAYCRVINGNLFGDKKEVADKEEQKVSMFVNSEVYKLVKFSPDGNNDYSEFEKLFKLPEFDRVDLVYYFNAVNDWSLTKQGVKRTKRGWIATVRNFIRWDAEARKLHLKPDGKDVQGKINISGAMEYIKSNY